MAIKVLSSLVITVMLCASVVQAKTATEVFEEVSPSVVVVKSYDAKGKGMMLGSGVVLEDGVVVTNCHVMKEAATMQVERQQIKYPATLLHSDWDRDICSLAVDGLKGQTVIKGSTARLKVGDKVYAVGAPQGLDLTLSDGLISSLRPVPGGQYLQITAPISPGSSGGGLFDEEGRLIGLPTFYLTEGQQLNFAVPVEWINELPKRNAPAPKVEQTTANEWINKAIYLNEKEDWPGLLNHAVLWTKAQPGDADAWGLLGNVYVQSGQPAKAIEAYQQAVHIKPEYAAAWYTLGIAYVQSGQPAKAIEAFQQAVRIKPEYADAWYNLGITYGESGQPAKAIEADQQAVRINPENDVAWYNLGIDYGKSGQTAKAIEAYQQAISINPENDVAWNNLGSEYGKSSQHAKEIEAYQQAISINPENDAAWCNLGIDYGKSGQTAKATEAFRQAISINPENADAWYLLGIAYKISGQTSQVMEVYKRLKTLDPAKADEFFNTIVMP